MSIRTVLDLLQLFSLSLLSIAGFLQLMLSPTIINIKIRKSMVSVPPLVPSSRLTTLISYKDQFYNILKMISHSDLRRNILETHKQRLFRFFHLLLNDYKISPYFLCLLFLIETLQILYFALHPACCHLWELGAIQVLSKVLGYINGSYLFVSVNPIITLVFATIVLLVYGATLAIIVYEIRFCPPENTISTFFQELRYKLVQYMSALSLTVLLTPVYSMFTCSILNVTAAQSSLSIISLLISILSFGLYSLHMYLFLNLMVDSSPFSTFPLSGPVNPIIKYRSLAKGVLAVVSSLLGTECSASDPIHLMFMLAFLLVLIYFSYLYFSCSHIINKPLQLCCENSNAFLVCCFLLIIIHKLLTPYANISLLWIVLANLLGNFTWVWLKSMRSRSLVFSLYRSLTTNEQILAYNYIMCQYIRDYHCDPLSLIMLEGILADHVLVCKKAEEFCRCKSIKARLGKFGYRSLDATEITEQTIMWFEIIKTNLVYNSEKMNHLPEFHLLLSQIEEKVLANKFLSYANLQKCLLKKPTLTMEFLIYKQKRIIQKVFESEDIKNNEKKQTDVNKYIALTEIVEKFQGMVLKSSLEHLDFWTALSDNRNKKKAHIMEDGNSLLETVKKCEEIYRQMSERFPNNLESIVLFSNYSKYILNNHELILKNKSLFHLIKKKLCRSIKVSSQQEKQKYSENSLTGAIIISGHRKNIGIIKYCTSKVTKILKYAPYELVGQNINTLMPDILGSLHNEVLFKYLEQAEPQSNFVERCAPMIDKNNFMILTRMMTKPCPSLLNGLEIIGLFERIRETSIRHMNEVPKYLLYRCDTGNVQAVSQNFYQSFGHRLMKVSQYSEISESFSFSSIFKNIYSHEVVSKEEGIECEMKLARSDSKKTMKVRIYVRLEIVYFGVKIKLLSIFSSAENNYNTLMLQNAMTINPSQMAMSDRSDTQVNGQTPNSIEGAPPAAIKCPSSVNCQQGVLREDQLKELQMKVPLKFRIFQCFMVLFAIVMVGLSSYEFYFNIKQIDTMNSYLEHDQHLSDSIMQLINIGYYSRLAQLASLSSGLSSLLQSSLSNVSTMTDSLQKTELWLVNKENEMKNMLNFSFEKQPLSWQINEQETIYSMPSKLSVNIFDLITSSSSFQAPIDFDVHLLQSTQLAKNSSNYRDLFRIRYSELFELIPAKLTYNSDILSAYEKVFISLLNSNYIELGVVTAVVVIFLALILNVLYKMVYSIFKITSLFNWLTPHEIDKEVSRCHNFLEHFFSNCYEVVLQLKKSEILRGHSFEQNNQAKSGNANQLRFMKTGHYNGMQETQNNKQCAEGGVAVDVMDCDQIDLVDLTERNSIRQNINNNQSKKSEGLGAEGTPQGQEQEEEQIQIDVQDQEDFSIKSLKMFVPITISFLLLLALVIGVFLFREASSSEKQAKMRNQNLLYQNIVALDLLKYYALEYTLDPMPFQAYQTLDVFYRNYSGQVYQLQQRLNALSNEKGSNFQKSIADFNSHSICASIFALTTQFSKGSYDLKECETTNDNVLTNGLRASIVAYVENTKKAIGLNLLSEAASSEVMKNLVLDKYIKSSFFNLISLSKEESKGHLDKQTKVVVTWLSITLISILLTCVIISLQTYKSLRVKILGTYQIISLIPRRTFQKNSNLCVEFRSQAKILLS